MYTRCGSWISTRVALPNEAQEHARDTYYAPLSRFRLLGAPGTLERPYDIIILVTCQNEVMIYVTRKLDRRNVRTNGLSDPP